MPPASTYSDDDFIFVPRVQAYPPLLFEANERGAYSVALFDFQLLEGRHHATLLRWPFDAPEENYRTHADVQEQLMDQGWGTL